MDLAEIVVKYTYKTLFMISREIEAYVNYLKDKYPIIAITGPRQSGKTILSKELFKGKPYVNLEDLELREQAEEDPKKFLQQFPQGAIIDEAQHVPSLFSYIQVLVDDKKLMSMFVLTGSQQFLLMKNISQSLSGRVGLVNLLPLSLQEFDKNRKKKQLKDFLKQHEKNYDEIIYHGFYPSIYDRNINPTTFYRDYIKTYVERDLRDLTNIHDITLFRKFMQLCAARTGQLLVYDSLAGDLGVSASTIKSWLSILETSYIIFLLQPYHENIGKRLIKSPKLYFMDVGLASYLLDIESSTHIANHPLRGNLFENLIVIEALKFRFNQGRDNNLNFYRDRSKEVDLLFRVAHHLLPIEIKSAETVSNKLFDNLIYFEKLHPDLAYGKMLVYGGDRSQSRTYAEVRTAWDFTKDLEAAA